MEQETSVAAGPDYTVWALVMQANPVVKGVMLILVLASLACWAIILEKFIAIWRLWSCRTPPPRASASRRSR